MNEHITVKTIGIPTLLTIVFVVLKLCKVIAWNWFWVLCPIIFTAGLSVVLLLTALIIIIVKTINRF